MMGCTSGASAGKGGASGGTDGGITSTSFKGLSTQGKMQLLKDTQKELKQAKANETKMLNEFRRASGAERMSPNPAVRSERRTITNDAHDKYAEAQDKRVKIENRLERYKRIYQKKT